MTPCPDEAALSRYHDKELEASAASALQAHLSSCEPCRAHLHALQRLDESILMSLSAVQGSKLAARRRPFQKLQAAAALFLVIGGLAVTGFAGRFGQPPRESGDPKEYSMVSPNGSTYQVKTRGEVQMLSLEVDGATTHFQSEERR